MIPRRTSILLGLLWPLAVPANLPPHGQRLEHNVYNELNLVDGTNGQLTAFGYAGDDQNGNQ